MNDTTSQSESQYVPQRYLQLYHVTTRYRADLIAAKGIDPERSKGARKVSWYVTWEMLPWAIAHVSLRHKTSIERIVVIGIVIRRTNVKATRWTNVYTASDTMYPDPHEYSSARACLKQYALKPPVFPF